jgi:tRNA (guanine37-N1)-methyltransferase
MKIKILTLFPEMFLSPLNSSLLGKAIANGLLEIELTDLRDFAWDRHKQVDDAPFGGGAGMVIKADVSRRALQALKTGCSRVRTIYLSPAGKRLTQEMVREMAREETLILVCGHYEGIDERALTEVDDVISIGDYILTGGELPALVLIDAVARLVPGVLGSADSTLEESFSDGLLEYPQYTRPREVQGLEVPPVLLSGNHEEIRRWRKKESLRKTLLNRPELLWQKKLDAESRTMLWEIVTEENGE